jgi:hypothetical protein
MEVMPLAVSSARVATQPTALSAHPPAAAATGAARAVDVWLLAHVASSMLALIVFDARRTGNSAVSTVRPETGSGYPQRDCTLGERARRHEFP